MNLGAGTTMNLNDQRPRVLLVLMTKVRADDPVNLLIRTEFGDWPKDRLAQIHANGATGGHGEICGSYYQLQSHDRLLGSLFLRLRRGVCRMVTPESVGDQNLESGAAGALASWLKLCAKRLGDWLVGSGLWEVIFCVRLSEPMIRFVKDFKPDLIYCQGYSLGFVTLPLLLARRFDLPICFQTTDDWPRYLYRRSPVGFLLRYRTRRLISTSKVRLAFGQRMQAVYESRYRQPFVATYHADRVARFVKPHSESRVSVRSIVFSGTLALRRYEAITDLLLAIRYLRLDSSQVEVRVYCSGIPKEFPEILRAAKEVRFLPLPSHEALPSVLAQADILFLPESFSVDAAAIKLSLSTKCHLYMFSGRPILAYGPSYSGTIDYACREGWAAVVNERSIHHLGSVLHRLFLDSSYRAQLVRRAREVACKNHELSNNRQAFLGALVKACNGNEFPGRRCGV